MLSEFQLIDFIKNKFNSSIIGDDAAVISFNNKVLVISKDILIENIHFILQNNFKLIGKKSLICNISDIFAMGVFPEFFFLAMGIPENISDKNLESLLDGMREISEQYNVKLAGGDLSRADNLTISITIVGTGNEKDIVYRSGAKVNDDIWVTGELGDSEIGLRIIKGELNLDETFENYFISRHYFRKLNGEFINTLCKEKIINSLIDISDGFLQDLNHILVKSSKSAHIFTEKIPVSEKYKKLENFLKEDFLKIPLISGEEYELIFTSSKKNRDKIFEIAKNYNVKITNVGIIKNFKAPAKNRIELSKFKIENLKLIGYKHF